MKKRLFAIILALALCLALCACGSSGAFSGDNWNGAVGEAGDMTAPGSGSWDGDNWDGVMEDVAGAVEPNRSLSEKIIYSANVDIETVDFDAAVDSVEGMLRKYGAFLESSSVSGRSYSETAGGYQTYRRAYFTIRVPVESFTDMKDELGTVGAVVSSNVYTENITERYYDTEARVKSYEIEQERLLAMLEKCETVSEMIEIESRLSEVRYQLEALESTLRNWQNEVDYSSIDVTVREVEEYKRVVEPHRTYWQQIGDGFKNTLEDVGSFFAGLFKSIVVALPVIVIVAALGGLAAVVTVKYCRQAKAKRRRQYTGNGQYVQSEYAQNEYTQNEYVQNPQYAQSTDTTPQDPQQQDGEEK